MDARSAAQELRLVEYLRTRGYREIVHGEEAVRELLELPDQPGCKCADVLGFAPSQRIVQRVVIAESKGTEISRAVLQLGNAAAGVIEKYGTEPKLELLLYLPALRKVEAGLSPGPGYLVEPGGSPGRWTLLTARQELRKPERARCELDLRWSRWNPFLAKYQVVVMVEEAPR